MLTYAEELLERIRNARNASSERNRSELVGASSSIMTLFHLQFLCELCVWGGRYVYVCVCVRA